MMKSIFSSFGVDNEEYLNFSLPESKFGFLRNYIIYLRESFKYEMIVLKDYHAEMKLLHKTRLLPPLNSFELPEDPTIDDWIRKRK
jgi:hypothetical protein